MKKLLFLAFLFPLLANAAHWYVRPTATGSANGSSWSNAWSMANLNANQASLNPGDTVWLAGGTYTTGLRPARSGTSGNVITYKRPRTTDTVPVAAAGWSAAFDAQVLIAPASTYPISWETDNVGSYVTIDGQVDSGIKAQLANISGNESYGGAVSFIDGGGITDITLRYIDIAGPSNTAGPFAFNSYVSALGLRAEGNNAGRGGQAWAMWFDRIMISHCRIHGSPNLVVAINVNQLTFEYCEFYHDNDLDSDGVFHENIMEIYSITDMVIRYCIFRDWISPTGIRPFSSDVNITMYGSLWYDGFICFQASSWAAPQWGPLIAYNNTFVNTGKVFNDTLNEGVRTGTILRNNLFYDADPGATTSFPNWNTNYNWVDGSVSGQGANSVNGTGVNPFVNMAAKNFRIVSTIASNYPRNKGQVLTAPYNIDMDGTIRGVDGAWDIGAFEFATVGDPVPIITSATINAAGTLITIAFSEAIQFGAAGGATGWALSMSGGAVTMSSPSGTGSSRTYTLSRTIGNTETGSLSYTQPGNGIEDTVTPFNDMASVSGSPITNNSTVPTTNLPQFAPVAGSYFGTQNVVMTSSTSGATIRYTTNGSDPTASSTQYTAGATGIPTSIGTTYRAKAFASGLIDSAIAQAIYELGTWVTASTAWKSFAVPSQAATFTWTFRASSSTTTSDGIIGLSPNLPADRTDPGPIIRFNTSGAIDARNGADYAAVNPFTYVAGTTYEIVCTVNVSSRTYSATASQIGGSPTVIATNYAFRSDSPTGALDNFGMSSLSGIGVLTVSQMSFGTVTGTIPAVTSATIGASGTNLTLGFDVPVSYGTGGNGGWTLSASGGAAILTPSASPTSFTISRAIAIGETVTVSYVQPGNGVEATTGGGDLASRSAFAANNQSTIDLTAPTPNPSTFSIVPTATGTSTITMTATTSTDANSGPVQYFFNETSGNAGGSDSNWQASPTYVDTGLAAGTQYTYRVRTRDSASTPNITSFSTTMSATTQSVAGAHPASPFNVARANIVSP